MFKNSLSIFAMFSLVLVAASSHAGDPHDFDYLKIDLSGTIILYHDGKTADYGLVDSGIRGKTQDEKRLLWILEEDSHTEMVSDLFVSQTPPPGYQKVYAFIGQESDGDYKFVRCFRVAPEKETSTLYSSCDVGTIRDVMKNTINYLNVVERFESLVKRDRSPLFRK